MKIVGNSGNDSDEVLLYQDDGTFTSCPGHFENSTGTSVCNKFVRISFQESRQVRYLNITLAEKWKVQLEAFVFNEVEVYGGKI